MGIHRDSWCRWTQSEATQKDNSFFPCARTVPLLTALPEAAKSLWTNATAAWRVPGWHDAPVVESSAPQWPAHFSSGSDFSAVCVYVILKLLFLGHISVPSLLQCSSTCGKGLQSRVVQCMHKVTGRHGNECPVLSKPAAYRQCHQEVCNEKINVNTITSPRLGEWGVLGGRCHLQRTRQSPGSQCVQCDRSGASEDCSGTEIRTGPPSQTLD